MGSGRGRVRMESGDIMTFEFTTEGKPTPKQRHRHTKRGRTYTAKKTKTAEAAIAFIAQSSRPKIWPMDKATRYRLEVRAVYSDRRHGDLDNVVKLVSDGLNGIAYPDDRQIAELKASRSFDNDNPRTEVRVTVLEEDA